MIIIIILAIVIPILIYALVTYTGDQAYLSLQEQASNIENTAIQVFDDGINTTLLLSITTPDSGNMSIGAPLYNSGGLDYNSAFVFYTIGGTHYQTLINNGAEDVLVSEGACEGPTIHYQAAQVGFGSTIELSMTKEAPGATLCNQPVAHAFVELEVLSS